MSKIAGIDYSYTSPSIVIFDTEKELKFENLFFYNFASKKSLAGRYGQNIIIEPMPEYNSPEERFRNISRWASKVLSGHQVEEVVLEGYSMGSSAGLVFQIAENTSLLKQYMDKNGIRFTTPAPTAVKKNFTGSGNAKKPDMIDVFEKRLNVDIYEILGLNRKLKTPPKPIDDLVDSYANLLMHETLKGK